MFFEDPLQVPLQNSRLVGQRCQYPDGYQDGCRSVDQILNDGASVHHVTPSRPVKASLSVAFKGGLFLHKMQVLLLHLNPRRDRGFYLLDRT